MSECQATRRQRRRYCNAAIVDYGCRRSVLKCRPDRGTSRSTIKLLARCSHFIVDKEPHHETLPPRCCSARPGPYRLWQKRRSQARRSPRCCCRSCCSCCCPRGRRQTSRRGCSCRCRQGSCWCCCPGRSRRRQGRCRRRQGREEVILERRKKPASEPVFFVLRSRSTQLPPAEATLLIGDTDPLLAAAKGGRESVDGQFRPVVLMTQMGGKQMLQASRIELP